MADYGGRGLPLAIPIIIGMLFGSLLVGLMGLRGGLALIVVFGSIALAFVLFNRWAYPDKRSE
jgi:hypothetical protein